MQEFGFVMKVPQYYTPDASLVNTLKICIEQKQSNPQGLENISKQIRGGMDRNQFNTNASTSS